MARGDGSTGRGVRRVLLMLVIGGVAEASPVADIGTVAAGARPGTWVVTTDAADAAYSFGRAILARDVTGPFELSLVWRRMDADLATSEIWLPGGGVVLLHDGEIGLWNDNASFDGYRPLPGFRTQRATRVEVVQRATTLEVRVDGAVAGTWARAPGPAAGSLSVALKAAPRRRAKLRISDVALTTRTR